MNEQFICISCWKEFTVDPEEAETRGGKVVCPNCGYIQPLSTAGEVKVNAPETEPPEKQPVSVHATDSPPNSSVEEARNSRKDGVEQLSRATLEGHLDNDSDRSDETREHDDDGVSMADDRAHEKTPIVPLEFSEIEEETTPKRVNVATEWRLRTPSGLTFKFTDPEALFGWKKKLATYRQLEVSPDGGRWVDFSQFIDSYEQLGDAMRAFLVSEGDEEEVRKHDEEFHSEPRSTSADSVVRSAESHSGPFPLEPSGAEELPEDDSDLTPGSVSTTAQFTFKVKEEKESAMGKYFFLALLGLGLGAGIVYVLLTFAG